MHTDFSSLCYGGDCGAGEDTLLGVVLVTYPDTLHSPSPVSALSLALSVIKRRFSSARSCDGCDGATEGRRRWDDLMSVVLWCCAQPTPSVQSVRDQRGLYRTAPYLVSVYTTHQPGSLSSSMIQGVDTQLTYLYQARILWVFFCI